MQNDISRIRNDINVILSHASPDIAQAVTKSLDSICSTIHELASITIAEAADVDRLLIYVNIIGEYLRNSVVPDKRRVIIAMSRAKEIIARMGKGL